MPKTRWNAVLTAALIAAAMTLPARAAQYLDHASWAAGLVHVRNAQLLPFPEHSVVMEDGFGWWLPGQENDPVYVDNGAGGLDRYHRRIGPPNTSAGQWNGIFNCHDYIYPCLGTTRTTYTLPFPILGVTGHLSYRNDTGNFELDFFPNDMIAKAADWYTYNGFFAAIFHTPVSSLDVQWLCPACDAFQFFSLSNAQVLVGTAVPEPAALSLFTAALLGLATIGRRRNAV